MIKPNIGDLLIDFDRTVFGVSWPKPTVGYIYRIETFHLTDFRYSNWGKLYYIKWILNEYNFPNKMYLDTLNNYLTWRFRIQRVSSNVDSSNSSCENNLCS